MTSHPLDRPVWNALTSRQSHLAIGDAHALRIDPDHGPFAAPADFSGASLQALSAFVAAGSEIWCVEAAVMPAPSGVAIDRTAVLHQMVAAQILGEARDVGAVPLTEADAADMRALAAITRPGPFLSKTHRLGRFIGVRQDGALVAMAGERMRLDGFTEVSGVCTHPDYRGRGYAAALIRDVAQAMLDRGETPFLHSYANNAPAIALYESLGFALRSPMHVTVLVARGCAFGAPFLARDEPKRQI